MSFETITITNTELIKKNERARAARPGAPSIAEATEPTTAAQPPHSWPARC
jgi:hypothetical protein